MQNDTLGRMASVRFEDILKLDVRVGLVIEAKNVEESKKLIELTVDLGSDYGVVTIFTGMQKWYKPENFQNKKFLFIANLEPKKMLDSQSQGMILAADQSGVPSLIEISPELPQGTKIL